MRAWASPCFVTSTSPLFLYCLQVLSAEPGNVKALLRRALAREQQQPQGKAGAVEDVEAALKLEPGNKEATAQRERLLAG